MCRKREIFKKKNAGENKFKLQEKVLLKEYTLRYLEIIFHTKILKKSSCMKTSKHRICVA